MTTRAVIGLAMLAAPPVAWVLLLGFSGEWREALHLVGILVLIACVILYLTIAFYLFTDEDDR